MSAIPDLSVCMIVRDEARVLGRCLNSLGGIFQDLCIVDTGSIDESMEVARAFGARVQRFTECNDAQGRIIDFSAARNVALDMARGRWVLQIDADEVIDAGLDTIAAWIRLDVSNVDMLRVAMHSGRNHCFPGRVFRRSAVHGYRARVHEYLDFSGTTRKLPEVVLKNLPDKRGKESSTDRNFRLGLLDVRDSPSDAHAHFYLGEEYRVRQRFPEAIECYSKVLALGNFPAGQFHAAYARAVCFYLSRDLNAARYAAADCLRIDRRYAEAYCLVGDIYHTVGRVNDAADWYRAALGCGAPPEDDVLGVELSAYADYPRRQLELLAQRVLAEQTYSH